MVTETGTSRYLDWASVSNYLTTEYKMYLIHKLLREQGTLYNSATNYQTSMFPRGLNILLIFTIWCAYKTVMILPVYPNTPLKRLLFKEPYDPRQASLSRLSYLLWSLSIYCLLASDPFYIVCSVIRYIGPINISPPVFDVYFFFLISKKGKNTCIL